MAIHEPAHKILLDTHIALWILLDDPKLPNSIREKLTNNDYCWYFHQVSLWEIQIKYDLGNLKLPQSPEKFFGKVITESGFIKKNIEDKAIFMLGKLPNHHRDPFDRLLISHALINNWMIVTVDKQFESYPVQLL